MKEIYFTPDTIEVKARAMMQAATEKRGGEQFLFVPEQSALLVLDMQAYFLDATSQAFHQTSLLNLAHGFAELKLVGEILESLVGKLSHD